MSPHQQARPQQNNNPLIFLVASLFLAFFTFLAVFYMENDSSLSQIKKNQQTGIQSRDNQQQDLTKITCSIWSTLIALPDAHPPPDTQDKMRRLCGT